MATDKLDQVVRKIWSARDPDPKSGWLDGLGRSDVRRALLAKVCSRALGIPAPGLAGRDEQEDRQLTRFDPNSDPERLRTWFREGGWEVVERLCTVAGALKRTTVDLLRDSGTPTRVRPRDVALWALAEVGRRYWHDGVEPTAAELREAAETYRDHRAAEGPMRAMRMDEAEFLAEVAAEWDTRWPPDWPQPGFAPSALGLGQDRRPPLAGWRGGWKDGTDRSVYSRYRRYFDASSRSRLFATDGLGPEQHVTRRHLAGTKRDVALAEVDRACQPLGLALAVHARTVVAVSRGLGPGTAAVANTALVDWSESSAEPGPELSAAVARWAVDWIENCKLAEQLDLGGPWLAQGVVRRFWHYLHGREVEWDTTMGRADVVRLVKMCFGAHLCEKAPPEPDPGNEPVEFDDREQTTADLINDDPDGQLMVARLLSGDPRWRADYANVVPAGPRYLTADEFHAYCAGYGVDLAEDS